MTGMSSVLKIAQLAPVPLLNPTLMMYVTGKWRKRRMNMSKTFESGVLSYIHGVAYVDNFFPVDKRGVADINCYQCRFFSRNNGICQLTKEIVPYPQKYVGAKCPLEFEGDDE
jgi:hypothetical protein